MHRGRRLRAWAVACATLALATAIAGCGDDGGTGPLDAGGGADSGSAGGDGGSGDAGASTDSGAATDAGAGSDAGLGADAGPRDAGATTDGGMCTDDSREDNDTIAVAMAGSPIYSLSGSTTLDSLVACPGDDDYYYGYSDCCSDAFGAELRWAPADGALELSIVDSAGTPIAVNVDETAPGNRRLLQTAPTMSTYFFARVHNPGSTPVAYTLVVYAFVFGP